MRLATQIARRVRYPAALLAGPGLALVALGACTVAPPAADAALVASALALLGGSGWVAVEVLRLSSLPLEIAPHALQGEVDAQRVLRIRARLGLGRLVRGLSARVVHEGPAGATELPVHVPAGPLVGPFTLLATDPEGRTTQGRLRVSLTARGVDREWSSEAVLPCPPAAGRFGGVSCEGGKVRFEDDWCGRVE